MKNEISVERFFELSDEQIQGLFNDKGYPLVKLESINRTREAFSKAGITGDIIMCSLNHAMNIVSILEILTKNHTVKTIEQQCIIPNRPEYGFKWYIELFHDIDVPLVTAEDEELIYALWELLIKVYVV